MRIQLLPNRGGATNTRGNWPASALIEAFSRCTFLCMSQSRTPGLQNRFADHTEQRLK